MRGFIPFKDRTVEPGQRVQVYRKIVGGKVEGPRLWSIRGPEGLVLGHATSLTLYDAYPYVNRTAAERIRAGGAREVHAWINGTITRFTTPVEGEGVDHDWRRVTYNPRESNFFYDALTLANWDSPADVVVFNEEGMFV